MLKIILLKITDAEKNTMQQYIKVTHNLTVINASNIEL